MIQKIVSILIFSTCLLMSYDTGDRLDENVVKKLGLQKDKVYVVDFFASWCHACKKELPLISKLYDEKVVEIVGINVDKDSVIAKNFVTKQKLSFPIVYDTNHALISKFNPAGIPALYYIRNAKVLKVQIGAIKHIDIQIKKEIKGL